MKQQIRIWTLLVLAAMGVACYLDRERIREITTATALVCLFLSILCRIAGSDKQSTQWATTMRASAAGIGCGGFVYVAYQQIEGTIHQWDWFILIFGMIAGIGIGWTVRQVRTQLSRLRLRNEFEIKGALVGYNALVALGVICIMHFYSTTHLIQP